MKISGASEFMFAAPLARRSGQLLQVWGNSIQNASVDTGNEIKVVVIETYTFKQAGIAVPTLWPGRGHMTMILK
jgi:hypothetical protein